MYCCCTVSILYFDGVGISGSSSIVVAAVGLMVLLSSVLAVGLFVLMYVTAVGLFVTSSVTTVGLFVGLRVGLVGLGSSFIGDDWAKNKASFFRSEPEQSLGIHLLFSNAIQFPEIVVNYLQVDGSVGLYK